MKLESLIVISCLLLSCDNNKQPETSYKNSEPTQVSSDESTRLEQLKVEASRLKGGGSVKEVKLKGENATISYVKDFKEYKEINPQSSLTETELKSYWATGAALEKGLVDGPVRIMKNLDFVKQVTIILPYKNTTYHLSVSKSELEKFIGKNFNAIKDNWDEMFVDPYVYNDKGRKEFLQEFQLSISK